MKKILILSIAFIACESNSIKNRMKFEFSGVPQDIHFDMSVSTATVDHILSLITGICGLCLLTTGIYKANTGRSRIGPLLMATAGTFLMCIVSRHLSEQKKKAMHN